MENRRLFTFLMVSVVTLYLWGSFVAPALFPPEKKKPAPDVQKVAENAEISKPAEAAAGDVKTPGPEVSGEVKPAENPEENPVLGSASADSAYALEVSFTSRGGAIAAVKLADPHFRDLKHLDQQVQVVGNNETSDRTFSTSVDLIDQQLRAFGQSLETAHWKVVDKSEDESSAKITFSYLSPDQTLEVVKTYIVKKLKDRANPDREAMFRNDPAAHTLEVELKLINHGETPKSASYELQGPVGVLLENLEHTSKWRDLKLEFLGDEEGATLAAKQIASQAEEFVEEKGELDKSALRKEFSNHEPWTGVFRYAGIDVQFFAALIAPLDERPEEVRLADKRIDRTYPVLIQPNARDARFSDVSFRIASRPVELKEKDSAVSHKYAFFVGPKRKELLDPQPLAAARVLDYGDWFGLIARGMHRVLDVFHQLGLPYVLAIISLTVLVRGLMFPLSRKQAISAAKMKDLQPKLAELKARYGDDKEKLARAQMELWRRHKINPLGGCLPLFFQLPIFIGLFTSLNTAVDLRLARFLWINNLAAPDALFRLPFELPFLGYDFNVLPCLTVVLFLIQQKLFMPPAADEQQEAQHRMMNFMTVFMGFLFWHQPAGLCVYYIASSLWSIAERKLLGATTKSTPGVEINTDDLLAGEPDKKSPAKEPSRESQREKAREDAKDKLPPFLRKLLDAANENQNRLGKARPDDDDQKKKKKR